MNDLRSETFVELKIWTAQGPTSQGSFRHLIGIVVDEAPNMLIINTKKGSTGQVINHPLPVNFAVDASRNIDGVSSNLATKLDGIFDVECISQWWIVIIVVNARLDSTWHGVRSTVSLGAN